MGLFAYLKKKFAKKSDPTITTYARGLSKSREGLSHRLTTLAKKYGKVNEEYFTRLEEILLAADVGVRFTLKIIDEVLTLAKEKKISDPHEINELLIDRMFIAYAEKGSVRNEISFVENGPTVLLIAGVNGAGKTTTIAKFARRYLDQGKKVMLCAADTFRAGASEQLAVWADRLSCPLVFGKENADPASVAYEGARRAKEEKIDLLIVDTAGRLQNKEHLMRELTKIARVLGKEIPNAPHEAFLIIDATMGQNGVVQAREFLAALKITGIVITKMDGTSKGGIILAIRDEIGLPVRFIGLGEQMDDLTEFDLDKYLYGLCLGEEQ